jgi:hypothetical protein
MRWNEPLSPPIGSFGATKKENLDEESKNISVDLRLLDQLHSHMGSSNPGDDKLQKAKHHNRMNDEECCVRIPK